jgi:hypothetical protein
MRAVALFLAGFSLLAQQNSPPPPAQIAPSESVNEYLPKWLRFSGEYRARFEGFTGGNFRPDNDDHYVLNRFRVNLRVQPSSWLAFQFQGQDARAFGRNQTALPPLAVDTMDLRIGYVEFGNSDNKAFGLRAGRQELVFGDQRLVGHVSWLNVARTFDAVRLTVRQPGIRLDTFASSVVVPRSGEFNKSVTGDNFHGIHALLDKLVPSGTVEVYGFWRLAPNRRSETGVPGQLDAKTYGFRWFGELAHGFDYATQMVLQRGTRSTDDVRAWAGQWTLGRTFAAGWSPRVLVEYNYATGDEDPRDGRRQTFDILYPTPHDLYGLADQVGWKNLRHVLAGVELKPHPRVRLVPKYHSWWRASLQDGVYNAGGVLIVPSPGPGAGRHIGQELDLQAFTTLNSRMNLVGGIAHIFPGTYLQRASGGASYTFPYAMLVWSF